MVVASNNKNNINLLSIMKKTILKFNMVVAVIAMMLLATSCIKTQSGVDKDELREIDSWKMIMMHGVGRT